MQGGRILVALAATVVGFLLAGCGGSDSEADTAPPTVTVPAANQRLSAASWDTYVASAAQAQKVNQAAIKTFSKCRDLVARHLQNEKIQQCFGDSASSVVTEGQKFLSTLEGFDSDVAGACAKALTDYQGYVKLYLASVNALDTGMTSSDSPPDATQVDQAQGALVRARTSSKAFETACKPTA